MRMRTFIGLRRQRSVVLAGLCGALLLTQCYHGHDEKLRFGRTGSKISPEERELIQKIGEGIPTGASDYGSGAGIPQIEPNKPTRVILQVDGGGIMGITPAVAIAQLESALLKANNKRLKDVVAVMSGTSTGAIITGMLTAGVPAKRLETFYLEDGVKLFESEGRHRTYPIRPKFKRPEFQQKMVEAMAEPEVKVSPTISLGELKNGPQLIIPAYDLRSRRTHFFTNQHLNSSSVFAESMDKTFLLDAISASALSAANYFGKLVAPAFVWEHLTPEGKSTWQVGAAFQDGGQGTQNNTLGILLLLALTQGWAEDGQQLVVISFGTGGKYIPRSYSSVESYTWFKQVFDYIFNNQAKNESILLQWRASRLAAQLNKNVKLFRFDYTASPDSDPFSAEMWRDYQREGEALANRPDFKQMVQGLVALNSNLKQEPLKAVDGEGMETPQAEQLRGLIRKAMRD